MDYDNYLFDLYGTLIDMWTDEMAAQTWKKWLKWLDSKGVKHPKYYVFRRDFFDMDSLHRKLALEKGDYKVPEIDVIPIYKELFIKYGNPEFDDEFLNEASYAFRVASRRRMQLFDGVEEFLIKRHEEGKKLFLLSNAQASYTYPEIVELGLDKLLDDIMMSSDYLVMKPDKAFYDFMLNKHKLDKSKTVMIGDSFENDYQGGIGAGISAIHLSGENDAKVFWRKNI